MTEQTKPGLPRGVASTPEARDAVATLICDELEKGLSIKVACDLVGVTNAWYYRWRKLAEQGNEEAIGLMRRLAAARAKGFKEGLGRIKAKAETTDDWRADAWLIDKLYPGWTGDRTAIEEIEYQLADQDDKPDPWARPDAIRAIVQFAVESGLVPIEQLLAMAPKGQQRPSIEQPAADPLESIRDAVVDALADGPREPAELRDVVCALTSCSHEQFEQACADLEFEQLTSSGSKPLVRLANRATGTSAVQPTADQQVRTDEPASPSANRGSWLGGEPGTGVGDMIARRRG